MVTTICGPFNRRVGDLEIVLVGEAVSAGVRTPVRGVSFLTVVTRRLRGLEGVSVPVKVLGCTFRLLAVIMDSTFGKRDPVCSSRVVSSNFV